MTEKVTHALEPDDEDLGMSGKADAELIHSQTAACYCLFDKCCQWIAVGRLGEGNSPF